MNAGDLECVSVGGARNGVARAGGARRDPIASALTRTARHAAPAEP